MAGQDGALRRELERRIRELEALLEVSFDLDRVQAGHFGLEIMRERCQAVDARLCVESAPGTGTHVLAEWTANGDEHRTKKVEVAE